MTKAVSSRKASRAVFLASTCAAVALATSPARAQENVTAEAVENAEAGDIVITGSRVRGAAPVGSTVISIGRTDLESSSAATVDRLIREIPQVLDLGVSENSRAQAGGSLAWLRVPQPQSGTG